MNENKSEAVKNIDTFKENIVKFKASIDQAYGSVNILVDKIGFIPELKSVVKGIYMLKLNYLELRKEQFSYLQKDLNMPEFDSFLEMLRIQNDELISKTHLELDEIDK
jgi:hypothetical protein